MPVIVLAWDAGSTSAGVAILRVVSTICGPRITCEHHAHVRLEMDGGAQEGVAEEQIIGIADHALQLAGQDDRILSVVEGIEGITYAGNQPAPFFATADQAGAIRMGVRMWARLRHVEQRVDVRRTTAASVRRFLFHRQIGGAIGDSEVVLAVQQFVQGMPAITLPVKESDKAMHAYDAAAAGLAALAQAVGWTSLQLSKETLTEIVRCRFLARARAAEKKARKALGLTEPKKPRPAAAQRRGRGAAARRAS